MHHHDFAKSLRQRMTDAEHLLWRHLRAHRLNGHKFRRQQPLGPYVVDFVHFGARVIVEADGGQHADSPRDAMRDAWLRQQGFTVLRFWNDDILLRTGSVLEVIWSALEAAPSPLTPLPQGERGTTMPTCSSPLSPRGRGAGGEGDTP
jgi:very-short-patch-repair endonuclease